MAVKLLLVALALLSSVGIAASDSQAAVVPELHFEESDLVGSSCKSTSEQIGPCDVHFSVCYGFHKLKWRYTATACTSGICASSGRTESAKGAAEDAAKALFAMGPACTKPAAAGLEAAPIAVVLEEPEESFEPRLMSSCKSETQTVGPCSVHFSVCYGFHKLKWRYTATACTSGICATSGHTKSAKGAAEDAAKALFAMGPACAKPAVAVAEVQEVADADAPPMLMGSRSAQLSRMGDADEHLMSSCKSETQTVGPCSVHFSVCYGFHKLKWRYNATACTSGICATSGHTKSAKGAAEDAAKALFAMGPACAKPADE